MALDPAKARRFAQSILLSGVRQGMSGASILEQIRAAGLSYGNEAFYNDYNRYQGRPGRLPLQNDVEFHQYLSDNLAFKIPTKAGTRYGYQFSVSGIDPSTGEFVTKYASVSSSKQLIPSIAQAAISQRELSDNSGGNLNGQTIEFDSYNIYSSQYNV